MTGTVEAATDTFPSSGTWTAPAGVTSATVEAWGGGGAGGGATGNPAKGGGGAGGQYASKVVTVS
ncbi:MAG: glycine-rich domain-containing protein, partial [Gallionella sp.]